MKMAKQTKLNLLYKPLQIAEILGVSVRTIYDWVYKRKIPFIKVGRLVRFDPDEISEWMKKPARSNLF